MADSIHPFRIDVPDDAIESLKSKLSNATFPIDADFSDSWDYGAPLGDIKRLAEYWRSGFDWRAQEAKLNKFPQFMTTVSVEGFGDISMHFLHQRGSIPDSIPLVFIHGWPGSFIEVVKMLPLLTEPNDGPSFHVVAPSIPNFGFSGVVKKKGFTPARSADAIHQIMLKLGYSKYVSQGGDWGFFIARYLGIQYPQNCVATHVNFVPVGKPPSPFSFPWQYLKHALLPYSESEKAGIARTKWFNAEGRGYNLLQSTKPLTPGFALADSPVALLAWIYEKLHDWTDSYPWTDDEILTWISIYQFSKAGPAASLVIYYENRHAERTELFKSLQYNEAPLGLSYFPKDLVVPPVTWGRSLGRVAFEVVHEDGGHFAAWERPGQLADDLRQMFSKGGGASHIPGKLLAKI